jgi:hypothetical protein
VTQQAWYAAPPGDAPVAPDRVRQYLEVALDDLDHPLEPLPLAPMVLRRDVYDDVFAGTRTILGLLRRALFERGASMPERAAALGVDPAVHYPLTIDSPLEDAFATCMTRPDVVIDADGPKFVEFNIGGAIGGVVETTAAAHAWGTVFGGADEAPFGVPDAMGVRDAFFARVAARLGVRPAVLVLGSRRAVATRTTRHFDVQVDSLRRHGLDAEFTEPEEVERFTSPSAARRFQLGLRYFTVLHWGQLGIDVAPVRRALDDGCLFLTTQTSYAIANKQVLAWVSEGRSWMTTAEREAVRRYVPWTRVLRDGRATWEGRERDLPELVADQQRRLVLKPSIGMRGQGVLVGRFATASEWRDRLASALATGDHVVQQYVEPVPYRLPFADRDEQPCAADVIPLLGPFLFDDRPAAIGVRYLPPGQDTDGVITVPATGALRTVALPQRRDGGCR